MNLMERRRRETECDGPEMGSPAKRHHIRRPQGSLAARHVALFVIAAAKGQQRGLGQAMGMIPAIDDL